VRITLSQINCDCRSKRAAGNAYRPQWCNLGIVDA